MPSTALEREAELSGTEYAVVKCSGEAPEDLARRASC